MTRWFYWTKNRTVTILSIESKLHGLVLLLVVLAGCLSNPVRASAESRCQERAVLDLILAPAAFQPVSDSTVYPVIFEWAQAAALTDFETARTLAPVVIRELELMLQDLDSDADDPASLYHLAFIHATLARVSLTDYRLIRAWQHGKRARELLQHYQSLQPDDLRVSYFLGLYEYYAGAAPVLLRWIGPVIGLKGDLESGISRLESVAVGSPQLSTEAARVLLFEVRELHRPSCRYTGFARDLVELYPDNLVFLKKWTDEQLRCEYHTPTTVQEESVNLTVIRECP